LYTFDSTFCVGSAGIAASEVITLTTTPPLRHGMKCLSFPLSFLTFLSPLLP